MKKLKIFLCHASEDKAEVKGLYDLLAKQGTDPWLDTEKLLPGQDWNFEINKALDDADVILLCLSKKSVSKEGYVQKEMRLAIDQALEMPEGRIFLIPARLEECQLPYKIKSYQWVDLFTAEGMDKLLKSLNARANQVKAQPLSAGGSPPVAKKSAPKKQAKPKTGTTINIQGNVTGSNIVIGNDNEVNS
ncbi:MAG: toll/interleukin-1 receptor domain-containing protein [Chloroflexi bacterium]|nr:toll/interleukin-1 receptor domain-containing protein [Chloroflexota bacterium]